MSSLIGLKNLGDIGNVIAAIGVILSLLIVAWEIRENTNALHADARLQMIQLGNQAFDWLRDPAMADSLIRAENGTSDLTEVENRQFGSYVLSVFNMWEQGYFLHQDGLMTDDEWDGWNKGMASAASTTGFREVWAASNAFYSGEFRSYVDEIYDRQ